MIREKWILSGTHVDRHGDKMTLNALEQMAAIANSKYIPITDGHNIRKPPIGRIISGEIVPLPDGEYHLVVEGEIFENYDDLFPQLGDGRKISFDFDQREIDKFEFSIERDHRGLPEVNNLVDKLKSITEQKPRFYAKKTVTVDLVQLIISGGIFVIGAIASGFLKKIGEDAYVKLKDSLKEYFSTKRSFNEKLQFTFYIKEEDSYCEITTLVIESNSETVEKIFDTQFSGLDSLISSIPIKQENIAKVYLEYENNQFMIKYAVRNDCVPLMITVSPENKDIE